MKLSRFPHITSLHRRTTVDLVTAAGPASLEFNEMPLTYFLRMREVFSGEEQDPLLQADHMQLQGIMMILDSLVPGQIDLEARRSDFKTDEEYLRAVRGELSSFGFSPSHFRDITRALAAFNGLTADDEGEARADFLDRTDSPASTETSPLPSDSA